MQTKLAARAGQLSRRIFASLPWGFRLAHMLSKLAADTQEVFGRFVYAEFLKAGVEGLPDINGVPALNLRANYQGSRAADKLPRGYGRSFGNKVWKIALTKFRNPEIVEEAISRVMMRVVSGDVRVQEGVALARAEGLIITAVLNMAMDVLRRQKPERPLLVRDDEGVATEIDIEDPHAFKDIEDTLSRADMAKIMRELAYVDSKHPERAPAWVQAQLDGLTNSEIAQEWGLKSPQGVFQWQREYLPAIEAIFNKYLRAVA